MCSPRGVQPASTVTQVEGAQGLAEKTAAPHKTRHRCASSSKLDTPPSIESDVNLIHANHSLECLKVLLITGGHTSDQKGWYTYLKTWYLLLSMLQL